MRVQFGRGGIGKLGRLARMGLLDETARAALTITESQLTGVTIGLEKDEIFDFASVPNISFASLDANVRYVFDFEHMNFSDDGVDFFLVTDTSNGSSPDTGASDYQYANRGLRSGDASNDTSSGTTAIKLNVYTIGAAANEKLCGDVKLFLGNAASRFTCKHWMGYLNTSGLFCDVTGSGQRNANGAVNWIRFAPTTGSITGRVIARAFRR